MEGGSLRECRFRKVVRVLPVKCKWWIHHIDGEGSVVLRNYLHREEDHMTSHDIRNTPKIMKYRCSPQVHEIT